MIRTYVATYIMLLLLLLATVLEYRWEPLPWPMTVALAIAAAKALMIAGIFMELRKEARLIQFTAAAGVFWILIFYGLSSWDFL